MEAQRNTRKELQTKPNSFASSGITDDFTNIGLGTTAAGMIFGKGEGEGVVLCSDSKVTDDVTKEIILPDYARKIVKVEENIYVVQAGDYFSSKCIAITCKAKAESYSLSISRDLFVGLAEDMVIFSLLPATSAAAPTTAATCCGSSSSSCICNSRASTTYY